MEHITKAALRRHFSTLRAEISPAARASAETAILKTLFSLPVWRNAPLVCGYMPVKNEIDTVPIWERATGMGKTYALPVTVSGAREGQMVFRRLSGYTPHELAPARFGLSEPVPDCPTLALRDFEGALILVPGLAFDDQGFRIGYGGGYYDRFLSALAEAGVSVTTVGLAFSVCRAASLPHENHDRPVDYIIDERRLTIPHGFTFPLSPNKL